MNKNYFSLRENIRILSIVFLMILSILLKTIELYYFAISWITIILILGNIRRILGHKGIKYFVRMTLYFIPYAIPSFFIGFDNSQNYAKILMGSISSLIIGSTIIYLKKDSIKIYFSKDYIVMSPKKDKLIYFLIIYNLIGAVICEELYFRHFLITVLSPYKFISILLSGIYFFLGHYILVWGSSFKKSDFFTQFIVGILSGTIYYFTKSIIPSIILHLILNAPNIILQIQCYNRHYCKKEYYDALEEKSIIDDLPI